MMADSSFDTARAAMYSDSYIYLDYAATTLLCEEAAAAMASYLVAGRKNAAVNANVNALHTPGRAAAAALDQARAQLARAVGAQRPSEIIFTSGATEADNAAVFGLARGAWSARAQAGHAQGRPEVITSAIEHDAVLKAVHALEAEGFAIVEVAPDSQGRITPEALAQALTPQVVLVSVQTANSEVGTVQDIATLARLTHEVGALFHTDAVQALGKVEVDVQAWAVDAASFSGHKVGGPKGIGALYLKAGTPFVPLALGGGQEGGLRSGTQDVCSAVGFAAACEASCGPGRDAEAARLGALRDRLYERVATLPGVRPTVAVAPGARNFLPTIASFTVEGFESQTLVLRLDQRGIGVSGGSACSSRSGGPSRVLCALGLDPERAAGALRVSMGRYTTEADIAVFGEVLAEVIKG